MWFDFLKGRHSPQVERLTGHISDAPEIITRGEVRYLAFRLAELPESVFWLKLFPFTPKRRPGDFVVVTVTRNGAVSGPVTVDAVVGIPDPTRRRPWDGA